MISSRSDKAYSISILSRFMANPTEEHWKGVKWILRYIKSTPKVGLCYKKSGNQIHLEGFVDEDYASNKDNRKSLTSYYILLHRCCISWKSQLQNEVALSKTEVEYIATTEAFKEEISLKGILEVIKVLKSQVILYSDN
ncbi:secreted RxLR effector protein 161-like [Humulus lupulus]|uniref:secreted RxLR effector protein 161-like n=1 Tax=Humulus lupulus TaxID=3486 RepID=UPI002B410DC2|nr:secreted RxLR effector protein 161-like [Humulus lupulus]